MCSLELPLGPSWRSLKAVCISEDVSRPVVCEMSLVQRDFSKGSMLIGRSKFSRRPCCIINGILAPPTVVLGKIDIVVQISGPHEDWTKFQKRSLTLSVWATMNAAGTKGSNHERICTRSKAIGAGFQALWSTKAIDLKS